MKKKLLALLLASTVVFSSVLMTGCKKTDEEEAKDPNIQVEVDIAKPNIEEFKSIEIPQLGRNINRDEFKVVNISVYTNYSDKYSDMKMTIPTFKGKCGTVDSIERYVSGNATSSENDIDRVYKYDEDFILYTKGLDNAGIKKLLNQHKLVFEYKKGDEKEKQTISLGNEANFIKK